MGPVWMTKYGARRVRYEPPTLEEALSAAADLTADHQQQLQLAADLLALPLERIEAEGARILARRANDKPHFVSGHGKRTVVVERKTTRTFTRGVASSSTARGHVRKTAARG